jgi:hypothetical protein
MTTHVEQTSYRECENMKGISLFVITVSMIGLGACAAEDPPADDQASVADATAVPETAVPETVQVPKELAMDLLTGSATPDLTGCGTLEFCADPRFTPHFPSFCTKAKAGCNNDKAFADAIALCKSVCAPTSICSGKYYVLGPC